MAEPMMTTREIRTMTVKSKIITIAATLLVGWLWMAVPAGASMQIDSFSTTSSTAQAGGHPDLSTSFTLHEAGVSEAAKNVVFEAPEGVFGTPGVLTKCNSQEFALAECSPAAQAGLVTVYANYGGNIHNLLGTAPLYELAPGAEETALFAFITPILNIPIQIPVAVRTGSDYGLRFKVSEITQITPLAGAELTLWGFPSSSKHNPERFAKGNLGAVAGCPVVVGTGCITEAIEPSLPNRPLIHNPTICSGQPLVTKLEVQTYQDPTHPTVAKSSYPPIDGCENEAFKPVLFSSVTTEEADSASGLNIELQTPQFFGQSPSPSELRSAIVTLPPELTINPDAADGQTECPESQANFATEIGMECPDGSKIGTFTLDTPALEGPLVGAVFIGEPKPNDQYRLFMAADGFGIHAKLVGDVRPDPKTGQVTVTFSDLPQVPFDDLQLHLFASDRGLMATPTKCTVYQVSGHFFPWNAALPDVISTDGFTIESGPNSSPCPGELRPFHPRLAAGTSNPVAGAFSSFTLKLERDDGDQFLGDLNFRMPPGFTGDLRGIGYCPKSAIEAAAQNAGRAEQAQGSCPASSQIGTTNVAAGPGSHPFHAVGKMYLAGPFKGAPLSLAAVTPALAGPYDYGVVVVRVALHVDPLTAQVSAISDQVPSIIGGIPIRMRSIQVNIDREHFTINPTNCSPFTVDSQGIGDEGTVTEFSSPFNSVNCSTLPFKPKMAVQQLGGRKGTRRSANPSLQFDLHTREGDANIKSIGVTLSNAFEIDQEHLGNLCTEKELAATQCAGRQQIGVATTTTPLLDQPLSGPVYAVSGSGGLPRLAFILDGQVDLLPRAETVTDKNQRLRTTVPVVPDAPIGHFHLVIFGGKHGYLSNTRSLCTSAPVVQVAYTGQNGKTKNEAVKVKAPCGKSKARPKRHRH